MSDKKIAKIYYESHVFLTQTGELYGYVIGNDGKPKCGKLNAQQKIAFWRERTSYYDKQTFISWHPVANNCEMGMEVSRLQEQRC